MLSGAAIIGTKETLSTSVDLNVWKQKIRLYEIIINMTGY